jgi:5-methylcytosine-specific restriction endonuclease McrA
MTDFDEIVEFMFNKFLIENEMDTGILIDLIKKHYSSRNYYHTEKIKELYNYFTQHPPYDIYSTFSPTITFLSKEEFFYLYITRILKDIYYFKADYENPHTEEQDQRYKLFINDLRDIMEKNKINDVNCNSSKIKNKKKAISATIKRLVWNTNIGEDIGKSKCLCCKATDITQMSFNCGHIVAEANGGETIVSNLKPICQNCNSSMATKNMDEFMKSLV